MTQKRIAFLISDMGAGGAQRVASILCAHWAAQGLEVSLLTFEPEGQEPFYELPLAIKLKKLNLAGGSYSFFKTIFANIKRIRVLRKTFKEIKPDVLVCFMPEGNILGILSTRFLTPSFPVLVSERSNPVIIPVQKIWRILRRITYPFAQTVICQTPKAASFFTWHKQAVSLPNPIREPVIENMETLLALPEKFISAVGRLGTEKGMDVLISAFAKITRDHPDLHLVIVGEGDQRGVLEQQIEQEKLQERIHLTGAKENPFSIAGKALIYVMPSQFEGFPNALCEAMVCGLPAIASKGAAGALPFIEDGENALLFKTGNAQDLAAKLSLLLNDPEKTKTLAAKGQKIKQLLSEKRVCAQWDSVIEGVLKEFSKAH